jgi:Protein of unknown function (DUF3723)
MLSSTSTSSKDPACVGSGILPIRHLRFELRPETRDLDLKHVDTLVRKFETDPYGCEPFVSRHRVPVIASASRIQQILSYNKIDRLQLQSADPPRLALPKEEVIICLHGRHRLAAGEAYLRPGKQWWGVDFYCAEG